MAAAATSFGAFDVSKAETWPLYEIQFENFVIANKVKPEKQKATFLANCGIPTLELLVHLLMPRELKDTSLEDILSTLRDHFKPKVSVFPARVAFYHRDQRPGESVAEFADAICRAAGPCKWQNLDDALRDRLIMGIQDKAVQRQLMKRETLTFAQAYEEALASEVAKAGAKVAHKDRGEKEKSAL